MQIAFDSPILLPDLAATGALAGRIAPLLGPGDMIALYGSLGAGKTAFARALIQLMTGDESADIPSPTFTIVQTYEAVNGVAIWHVDLYRIERPRDISELGLDDAFDEAVTIVEWPERLGNQLPVNHLAIHLTEIEHQTRRAEIRGHGTWERRLAHG